MLDPAKTYIKVCPNIYIKIYVKVRGRLSPQASWIRPRTVKVRRGRLRR